MAKDKPKGNGQAPVEPNEYTLSEIEFRTISNLNQRIFELEQQRKGALELILNTHNLQGAWQLRGDKLVRGVAPPPMPTQQAPTEGQTVG